MERIRYKYDVCTVLRLTKEDVARLTDACESHYDADVKALSKPGPGAILNAARSALEHHGEGEPTEFVDIEVTGWQLDTLCKATETMSSFWVARSDSPDLFGKLLTLLKENNAEWRRVNEPEEAQAS